MRAEADDELRRVQASLVQAPLCVAAQRKAPLEPPVDTYPRKWRSGQARTTNASVWEQMGVMRWREILSFAEASRAQSISVTEALRACSEQYGFSVSTLRGDWEAAGLIGPLE